MKKGANLKISILLLILLTIFIFLQGALFSASTCFAGAAEPSFFVSADGQSYALGDIISLTVNGRGVNSMYAFEVALVFDPAMLQYQASTAKVKDAGNGMAVCKIRDGNKLLFGFTRVGNHPGDSGDVVLCNVKFKALAEGTASVRLEHAKIVLTDETSRTYSGNGVSLQVRGGPVESSQEADDVAQEADDIAQEANGVARTYISAEFLEDAFNRERRDDRGVKTAQIEIEEKKGAMAYETVFPSSFFAEADDSKEIVLKMPFAEITIPANMLDQSEISAANSKEISIAVAEADRTKLDESLRAQIGSRPVIELSLKVDGKPVRWDSRTSSITVSMRYTPTREELEDIEHITVWYIDGAGNPASVPSGRYDPKTGMVTFTVNHFSTYAVVLVRKTFADLSGYSWAKKEIGVLASKGIIKGVGDSRFAPSLNITRADFLVLLVRTIGLKGVFSENFSDVKPDDYFYNEVGIAKKLGITNGIGYNLFDPGKPIIRQDMMAMASRALKATGKTGLSPNLRVLDGFADKADIAGYAVEPVAALVDAGLIKGSGGRINPLAGATRAEAAVMMYRIYNFYYGLSYAEQRK